MDCQDIGVSEKMRFVIARKLRERTIILWLVGVIFMLTIFVPLAFAGRYVFRNLVSGDYLLNVSAATAGTVTSRGIDSTIKQDQNLPVLFCREPRYDGIIADTMVRSFYVIDDDGNQYAIDNTISHDIPYEKSGSPCVGLMISPDRRPNTPNKYKFCQLIIFKAWGLEKHANFCSTEYTIVPN